MRYRPEIDGLRAVAVIPVILFHAGFESFEGGYVGVDAFFVISGYLITSIILTEKETGNFSLINFYERRARRILPALFLVMAASIPFAWWWLVPYDMKDFSESLIAVPTFVSNILFFRSETGYFAPAAELKPLLHTWSLAVEEQYYVLFPLFLLITWKLGKKWIITILSVIAIFSLVVSQWGSVNKPEATFYLLHTRGWELIIGVFVAFYLVTKQEIKGNQALSLLGLILVAYSILAFDKQTPFPSLYTLIPTLGIALVILFTSEKTLVYKTLSNELLVGIGLISYSAYLWHHPLFVFARIENWNSNPIVLYFFLSALSFVLAYLSWRFVEKPFRKKGVISRQVIFVSATTISVLFIAFGFSGYINNGFEHRFKLPASVVESFVLSDRQTECFPKEYISLPKNWYCKIGVLNAEPSYLVFGDSHGLALLDAFDDVGKEVNRAGVFTGSNGCVPFLGIFLLSPTPSAKKNCYELNQKVYKFVAENNIRKVFLVARWSYYTQEVLMNHGGKEMSFIGVNKNSSKDQKSSRLAFEAGLANTVDAFRKLDVELIVTSEVPLQLRSARNIYYRAYRSAQGSDELLNYLSRLSVPLSHHNNLQQYLSELFRQFESKGILKLMSFDQVLCNLASCMIGDVDHSYYYDDDHLGLVGATLSKPIIEKFLRDDK